MSLRAATVLLLLPAACVPKPAPAPEAMSATPRTTEPVTLRPAGWTCSTAPRGPVGERVVTCQLDGATAELTRWFGAPDGPDAPMEVASRHPVTVDGWDTERLRTRIFDGETAEVDVIFLRGGDWTVRLACRDCTSAQLDAVLAGCQIREAPPR